MSPSKSKDSATSKLKSSPRGKKNCIQDSGTPLITEYVPKYMKEYRLANGRFKGEGDVAEPILNHSRFFQYLDKKEVSSNDETMGKADNFVNNYEQSYQNKYKMSQMDFSPIPKAKDSTIFENQKPGLVRGQRSEKIFNDNLAYSVKNDSYDINGNGDRNYQLPNATEGDVRPNGFNIWQNIYTFGKSNEKMGIDLMEKGRENIESKLYEESYPQKNEKKTFRNLFFTTDTNMNTIETASLPVTQESIGHARIENDWIFEGFKTSEQGNGNNLNLNDLVPDNKVNSSASTASPATEPPHYNEKEEAKVPPMNKDYSLLGLTSILRSPDTSPMQLMLSKGFSFEELGIDADSSYPLLDRFVNPLKTEPLAPLPTFSSFEHILDLPDNTDFAPLNMSETPEETIFFIFYKINDELFQHDAARELQKRGWRFSRSLGIWITQINGENYDIFENQAVGKFHVYDKLEDKKFAKILKINLNDFDGDFKITS